MGRAEVGAHDDDSLRPRCRDASHGIRDAPVIELGERVVDPFVEVALVDAFEAGARVHVDDPLLHGADVRRDEGKTPDLQGVEQLVSVPRITSWPREGLSHASRRRASSMSSLPPCRARCAAIPAISRFAHGRSARPRPAAGPCAVFPVAARHCPFRLMAIRHEPWPPPSARHC